MPYFNIKCSYCGKLLRAYQRPNRPKQKKWYCNTDHYYKSGDQGGNTNRDNWINAGTYIRKRQDMKNTQIKEYGKKRVK